MSEGCGTILIIDDDERNIRLLNAFLEGEGYELLEATSGEEALKVFFERAPDLLLLDIMMPDIDGYEVCKRIREWEGDGLRHPIIMVTALEAKEDRIRATEAGADDFITKPVDKTELLLRVKSLMRIMKYQKRLMDQNHELLRMNKKLEELQKAKEELIHMIIHDLKNPLTGVLGNLEMLQMNKSLSEKDRDYIKKGRFACDRIMGMIQNILDVYKFSEGKITPRYMRLDIKAILGEIVDDFREKASLKSVDLNVEYNTDADTMDTDTDIFKRIMGNLISNAIRYSNSGESVTISVRDDGKFLRFSVTDTGPGIADGMKEIIFDRFEQLVIDGKNGETGSAGLGLTFCRMATESLGGKIWVEDNPEGRGSCFVFTLPRMKPL
ncbi:MAG: hybrid sensor histidine kinase/response regulator [Nitrospirae bacterium]|nr:MAG: hybrid sensor histidine kinase/response regulator [Nitrospirota bacterium]